MDNFDMAVAVKNDAISRSAVLAALHELHKQEIDEHPTVYTGIASGISQAFCVVRDAPALDVVPVVHAHWIKTFGSDGFVSTLRCSKCDNAENSTYIPGNFCWFCGAKMDGDSE